MSPRVAITHPDRVLFPTDGITKRELIEYYAEVAPVMVPHLKGRQPDPWAHLRRHARSLSRPRQRITKLQNR